MDINEDDILRNLVSSFTATKNDVYDVADRHGITLYDGDIMIEGIKVFLDKKINSSNVILNDTVAVPISVNCNLTVCI